MDHSADLRGVAKLVMWFESADDPPQYPKRFLAYAMTFGTLEEIIARRHFSAQDFEAVLAEPPLAICFTSDPR